MPNVKPIKKSAGKTYKPGDYGYRAMSKKVGAAKSTAKSYPKCASKKGQAYKDCVRDTYGGMGGATSKLKKKK